MALTNDRVFRAARRAGIAAIGIASAAAGLLVAFRLMPDHIPATPTAALLGLTGLVILPGLAVGGWALDCKALAGAVTRVRRPARPGEPASAEPGRSGSAVVTPVEPPAQRVHPAHDGIGTDHHKRRVAAARA